jgi:hypothetical protein
MYFHFQKIILPQWATKKIKQFYDLLKTNIYKQLKDRYVF